MCQKWNDLRGFFSSFVREFVKNITRKFANSISYQKHAFLLESVIVDRGWAVLTYLAISVSNLS